MPLYPQLAHAVIETLAKQMNKTPVETALGILRIAEANMAAAIRHVTAGKGHDPRTFTLVSFGGAGGMHAARLAEALDIPRILIPPHAGLLSALGMVVAPPLVDVSKTIAHLDSGLERRGIEAEFDGLAQRSAEILPEAKTVRLERFCDCRFHGQSYELTVPVESCERPAIEDNFRHAYKVIYGHCPEGRSVELVTLRLRRIGQAMQIQIPPVKAMASPVFKARMVLQEGLEEEVPVLDRPGLLAAGVIAGPALLADPDATALIPRGWTAQATKVGGVILQREGKKI
jgi:N-methylhydantoinase A